MKKNIILVISAIAIIAVILAVIIVHKNQTDTIPTGENLKTNDNVLEEINEIENTKQKVSYEDFVGVYVPEDDFYLEALFITAEDDTCTVYIKDPVGTYTDKVSISDLENGKIESDLLEGTYTVELTDTGIVFNSEMLLIEDLKMEKTSGKLDGIYENENYYFVMFTLHNDVIRLFTIDKETGRYFVEKSTDHNVNENPAIIKEIDGDIIFTLNINDNKLELKTDTTAEAWKKAEGEYDRHL